jgi:hypothetical protein
MTKTPAKRVAKGDVKAILADLRVMDHRAKLTAIYALTRLEHTGADGDPIEMKLSDAELDAEVRQLASMLGVVAASAAEGNITKSIVCDGSVVLQVGAKTRSMLSS